MLNSARFWVLVSGLILTVLLAPLLPNWQVNAQEGQPSLSEFEQATSEVGKEFQESKQEELDIQLNPNISEEEKVDKLTEIRRSFIDVACGIIDNFVNCDPAKIGGTPAKSNSNVNQGAGSSEDRFKLINEATQKCVNDGGGDIDRCYEQVLQKYQEVFDACIRNGGNSESCSKEANNSLSGVKVDPAKSPTGMIIEGVDCGANSANGEACESYIRNMTKACNDKNPDGCTARDSVCKGFEDYCKSVTKDLKPGGTCTSNNCLTDKDRCIAQHDANSLCNTAEGRALLAKKAEDIQRCLTDFSRNSGCYNDQDRDNLYADKEKKVKQDRYDKCINDLGTIGGISSDDCESINPARSDEEQEQFRNGTYHSIAVKKNREAAFARVIECSEAGLSDDICQKYHPDYKEPAKPYCKDNPECHKWNNQ